MSRHRTIVGAIAAVGLVLTMSGVALAVSHDRTAYASGALPLTATAGCGKAPTLTSGNRTIQSGGQNRSYIIRIPDNYDNNRPLRLVFAFHWNGGTSTDMDSGGTSGYAWSYFGLRKLADDAGKSAIFVAPQGNNNGWANPGGQDLTFVDDMIRQIEGALCVDTTQLFSTGFSYGAGMTYALACARSTVFRAVATYAVGNLSGCNGGTMPIAYFGIHGLRDNVLPISGGRAVRDQFVRNNGCTPQNAPEPAQGSLTHIVTHYSGCRAGYPVAWGAFDGPHAPNAVDGSADPYAPGERSWTQAVVWAFFTQFDGTTPTTPPTTPPTTSPTTSPTTPPPGGGTQIVGTQSGRCVTAPNQNAGTQVELQDCTGQAWTYTSSKQLQLSGNMCLDANGGGTSNGTSVIVWSCNGQANQQWNVNSNGTIAGVQSGLCLDANGAGTANGTKIILWSCNGQSNQQWSLSS